MKTTSYKKKSVSNEKKYIIGIKISQIYCKASADILHAPFAWQQTLSKEEVALWMNCGSIAVMEQRIVE